MRDKYGLLLFFILFSCASVESEELSIALKKLKLKEGHTLYLRVHRIEDQKDRWDSAVARQLKVFSPTPSHIVIKGLPPGDYAVRGFVDVSGDGELGMNDRGRPTEPFGFSYSLNRRKPSLRFSRAVFSVPSEMAIGFALLSSPK